MTPMLRQYLEIKEQYPDTILFYRMGDFYEMFFEDAQTASEVLGITLTSRSHKDDANRVPMCGVPFHALDSYLGKMVKAGFRVALCEQVENPKEAKGIVQREVVRIVSPGVTTDDQVLEAKSNCFICALVATQKRNNLESIGLAFLDISTGNFQVTEIRASTHINDKILDVFTRLEPAELLLSEKDQELLAQQLTTLCVLLPQLCITNRDSSYFDTEMSKLTLHEHFKTTNLAGFGCENMTSAIRSAGGLLRYIQETQKTSLGHIQRISALVDSGFLVIDESSRRNLELTETIIGGKREGSLISVLDKTATAMGARHLRTQLLFPLQDRERIVARLDAVENLLADGPLRETLLTALQEINDMERLCSRLVLGHGNARDIVALKQSLKQLPVVKSALSPTSQHLLQKIGDSLDGLSDLHQLISSAIRDDAPVSLREGRLIREGFHTTLDELIVLVRDGKQLILQLEEKERKRTGVNKLKVGFNKVFGYYFEISKAQLTELPDDFIRKQTLVNAERFITPELKELENKIASALEERVELEYKLFHEVRQKISDASERILHSGYQIARIDFLVSLARVARRNQYQKPKLSHDNSITIVEGRHPVIEKALESGRFVPNDVHLDQDKDELLIITGPNMAGKSTVLRQTALIVLLVHIGSFVPADSAEICLVDRIFTRVGAMDDLRRGQSTFMVEMNETANILNNATGNSLVILDEIGRGTSTYDGLAIAWAVAEELADKDGCGVKTMFATHYHELTDLASTHPRIQNYSIAVREWNDTIIFLHKLVQGAVNRSYGIQVAGLAGVPSHVVARAHEILGNIESGEFNQEGEPVISVSSTRKKREKHPCQLSLFPPQDDKIRKVLKKTNPDQLSPREALDLLYELCQLLEKNNVA